MSRGTGIFPLLALIATVPMLGACSLLLQTYGGGVSSGGELQTPIAAAPTVLISSPVPVGTVAPPTSPGPLASPGELAALLGPDDFTAVGVTGAGAPSFDSNGEPGSVYAVYSGLSSASGGIEMDAFQSQSPDDAATLVLDPGLYALDAASKQDLGADRATFSGGQPTNDGSAMYDTLWVQKGRLAVALGIPTTATSRDQLLSLAKLVLARSTAYQ